MVSAPWRVQVDPTRCIGSGLCAGTAPGQFQLVGGVSTSKTDLAEPNQAIVDAAGSCPTEAITVLDEVAGHLIAPQ